MLPPRTILAALMISASLVACGAAATPRELVDARAGLARAQSGQTAALAPVELHDAQKALDAAERAFLDEPEGPRTRDLAYVAWRKTELAEVRAGIAAAVLTAAQAKSDAQAAQAQGIQNARGATAATEQQIASAQQQITKTTAQLEAEKTARAAADKTAREAMEKMAGIVGSAVKEEPRGRVFSMPADTMFTSGKAALQPAARAKLEAVATALKHQQQRKVLVEVHTDAQSSEASNIELSTQRAAAVRDYLVAQGVSATIITASGIGQGRPVGDNKTADGRAANRRVEIVVQPVSDPY